MLADRHAPRRRPSFYRRLPTSRSARSRGLRGARGRGCGALLREGIDAAAVAPLARRHALRRPGVHGHTCSSIPAPAPTWTSIDRGRFHDAHRALRALDPGRTGRVRQPARRGHGTHRERRPPVGRRRPRAAPTHSRPPPDRLRGRRPRHARPRATTCLRARHARPGPRYRGAELDHRCPARPRGALDGHGNILITRTEVASNDDREHSPGDADPITTEIIRNGFISSRRI